MVYPPRRHSLHVSRSGNPSRKVRVGKKDRSRGEEGRRSEGNQAAGVAKVTPPVRLGC